MHRKGVSGMGLFGKLKRCWHRLRLHYLLMLYDSCLDEGVRAKLRMKIEYHDKRT